MDITSYEIFGIGNALVDTEYKVTDAQLDALSIEKGLMTLVEQDRYSAIHDALAPCLIEQSPGGSAANTLITASLLGVKGYFSCRTANDGKGRVFVDGMNRQGVDCREGVESALPTGSCLVMVTDDAERTMNTFLGVSATYDVADVDVDALKRAKWLYIEGYQATSDNGVASALHAIDIAKDNNIQIALSFSDPAVTNYFKDNVQQLLERCVDILFCNEEEALSYTLASTLDEAIDALHGFAKLVIVTLGSRGAAAYDGNSTYAKGVKARVVDTNGAGDTFAGAFMANWINGKDLAFALAQANKAASVVVSRYGPRFTPEEAEQLLKND